MMRTIKNRLFQHFKNGVFAAMDSAVTKENIKVVGYDYFVIIIRPAKKEDAPKIMELIRTVLTEQGIYNPSFPDMDISDIIDAYAGSGGEFFVAESEGKIIGTAGFYCIDADFAQFRRFYVIEAFRRQGIGKRLLDEVIRLAERKGVKAIISISEIELKRAHEVYIKAGFRLFKTSEALGVNYFVRPIGGYEPDFSQLKLRNWIIDWKEKCWQQRRI